VLHENIGFYACALFAKPMHYRQYLRMRKKLADKKNAGRLT